MTAHSPLGASSAHRWMNCPGSVALCVGIEDKGSFAAAEGTVAHSIGENALRPGPKLGVLDHVATCDGHAITVTQEMLDAVKVYVEYVQDRAHVKERKLEQRLDLSSVHPDCFGTADCILWKPKRSELEVIDYKHGAGVAVEVLNNKQLKFYALGALLTCGYPAKIVTVTIVQPRCPHPDGPIRSQTFEAIDLLDFAADLKEAAAATEQPDAPLHAGDWCRWCPAAGVCPEQRKQAQALARIEFSAPAAQPPAPGSLTAVELAQVLDKAPIVEAWIKAVREHAYTQAEAGNPPPNYKLVAKVAIRKVAPDILPESLAKAIGVSPGELYAEPKFLGIGELEKLAPGKNAKERAAALEPFVVRESSGHVLVHDSDRRPAVNPQQAAKLVFQTGETE